MDRCEKCGLDRDIVGRAHNCNPERLKGGFRISTTKKSTEPAGDGLALISATSPPGLVRKLAEAIKSGKLRGPHCQCPCCTRRREKMLAAVRKHRTKKKESKA